MSGFGLDSNIVSFHLKDNQTVTQNIARRLEAKIKVLIPPFVYYEVKRGLVDARATRQLRIFDELLGRCPVGPISQAVFEAGVDIYVNLKAKRGPLFLWAAARGDEWHVMCDNAPHAAS
jgi:tRNA(fMet)-specific endonuclease VapC